MPYFSVAEVASIVNRTVQTVNLWDRWSNEREANGESRLIPKATFFGKYKTKGWGEEEVDEIKAFAKSISYGDLAKYSRKRWGVRG